MKGDYFTGLFGTVKAAAGGPTFGFVTAAGEGTTCFTVVTNVAGVPSTRSVAIAGTDESTSTCCVVEEVPTPTPKHLKRALTAAPRNWYG